jgi:hypothetical protein
MMRRDFAALFEKKFVRVLEKPPRPAIAPSVRGKQKEKKS